MYSDEALAQIVDNKLEELYIEEYPEMSFTLSKLWINEPFNPKLIPRRAIKALNSHSDDIPNPLVDSYDRLLCFMEDRIATLGLTNKTNSNITSLTLQSIFDWNKKLEIAADSSWSDILRAVEKNDK